MSPISSPTSRLPPIRKVGSCPINELSEALTYLRHIYNPEVRGSRRRRSGSHPDLHPPDDSLNDLRSDAFERSYAIKWLTALISKSESWITPDAEFPPTSTAETISGAHRESLVENAAALLAICSGTAAAGIVTRDFVFPVVDGGGVPVRVHIRDVPLDNGDYGSVGAQTWGGACVLAEMIVDEPARFGLPAPAGGIRVLELGAGTGLVSLTLAKLLATGPGSVEIVATDWFPPVLSNLSHNIVSNFPSSSVADLHISAHPLDWTRFPDEPQSPALSTPFDVVLGADIIYEAQHAQWVKACLARLLRRPTAGGTAGLDPTFHLVIPLRATHSLESRTVETVFSAAGEKEGCSASEMDLDLCIVSRENILCEAGNGLGVDQVEYAYYRIAWC